VKDTFQSSHFIGVILWVVITVLQSLGKRREVGHERRFVSDTAEKLFYDCWVSSAHLPRSALFASMTVAGYSSLAAGDGG